MVVLQVNLGQLVPIRSSLSSTSSRIQHLGISAMGFFTGQMSFLPPSQQWQSTDPNQWPRLILSSFTTGLLKDGGTASFSPPLQCQYQHPSHVNLCNKQ